MEFGELREVAVLNQRIRRVLSVFRVMAAHMCVHGSNPEDSASHLCGRIGAIGRVALAPALVDGIDLEALVRDELLLTAATDAQFAIQGPEARLTSKTAELMSLLIHELTTNALKFGALCQSRAKIAVTWRIALRENQRILQFDWLESGVQMSAGAPSRSGFGTEVVERLIARELQGEGRMTFMPDGVRCMIKLPLSEPAQP